MLISDMISSFTPTAYSFVSFEIGGIFDKKLVFSLGQWWFSNNLGYFVYDMIDMLKNSSGRQTYEVVLHHLTVLL